jgi:SNF2 family DNA or RNA helicase
VNRFVTPISNGQCADNTPADVRLMKQRVHVLYQKLKEIVHRRDHQVLTKVLPPITEFVLLVRLSKVQRRLYKHFLDHVLHPDHKNAIGLIEAYHSLMKASNNTFF